MVKEKWKWYKFAKEYREKIEDYFKKNFRYYEIFEKDEKLNIIFVFDLKFEGVLNKKYIFRIVFPELYPVELPEIYELTNEIPRSIDRHIFKDGKLCIMHRNEIKDFFPDSEIKVNILIGKCLYDYLRNQLYFELFGKWINGDYSHIYPYSVIQYFSNYYNIDNMEELKNILKKCIENNKMQEKECLQIKQKFSIKELEKICLMLEYILKFYENNHKIYDMKYVYKKYLEKEGDESIGKH